LARNSIESRRLRFESTVSGHKRVCRYLSGGQFPVSPVTLL